MEATRRNPRAGCKQLVAARQASYSLKLVKTTAFLNKGSREDQLTGEEEVLAGMENELTALAGNTEASSEQVSSRSHRVLEYSIRAHHSGENIIIFTDSKLFQVILKSALKNLAGMLSSLHIKALANSLLEESVDCSVSNGGATNTSKSAVLNGLKHSHRKKPLLMMRQVGAYGLSL